MNGKMKARLALAALLVLVTLFAMPSLAKAGGWVVVTLDQLPGPLTAGDPVQIGMTARQHGKTPWVVDALQIEARHAESGTALTFAAKPDGTPGHYRVELVLPEAGRWEWGVSAGMFPEVQPMPALEVGPGAAAAAPAAKPGAPSAVLGISAGLAFAAGAGLILGSRRQRFPLLAGMGLLVVCGGLAFGFFRSASAQAQPAAPPVPVTSSQVSIGQQLFLAKGCVTCHTNDRAIQGSAEYGVDFGPNLTVYRNDPDYLHTLLKDPESARPGAQMPNLELKLEEIEALISFLNGGDEP